MSEITSFDEVNIDFTFCSKDESKCINSLSDKNIHLSPYVFCKLCKTIYCIPCSIEHITNNI